MRPNVFACCVAKDVDSKKKTIFNTGMRRMLRRILCAPGEGPYAK